MVLLRENCCIVNTWFNCSPCVTEAYVTVVLCSSSDAAAGLLTATTVTLVYKDQLLPNLNVVLLIRHLEGLQQVSEPCAPGYTLVKMLDPWWPLHDFQGVEIIICCQWLWEASGHLTFYITVVLYCVQCQFHFWKADLCFHVYS